MAIKFAGKFVILVGGTCTISEQLANLANSRHKHMRSPSAVAGSYSTIGCDRLTTGYPNAVLVIHNHEIKILSFTCVPVSFFGNSKLCMGHRNKIKVPDPVVKDLTSKK